MCNAKCFCRRCRKVCEEDSEAGEEDSEADGEEDTEADGEEDSEVDGEEGIEECCMLSDDRTWA